MFNLSIKYQTVWKKMYLLARFQIAKFAVRGEDLPHALLYLSAQNI